jgi:hypothetical protein
MRTGLLQMAVFMFCCFPLVGHGEVNAGQRARAHTMTVKSSLWKGYSVTHTITPLPQRPVDKRAGRQRFIIKTTQEDTLMKTGKRVGGTYTRALIVRDNLAIIVPRVRLNLDELPAAERRGAKLKVEAGVRALDKMLQQIPLYHAQTGEKITLRTRPMFTGKVPVGWDLRIVPGNGGCGVSNIYLNRPVATFAHEAAHMILSAPDEYVPFRPPVNGVTSLMSGNHERPLVPHSLGAIAPALNAVLKASEVDSGRKVRSPKAKL